ncbi:hypothetical protein, partial [Listeria ivanovii]
KRCFQKNGSIHQIEKTQGTKNNELAKNSNTRRNKVKRCFQKNGSIHQIEKTQGTKNNELAKNSNTRRNKVKRCFQKKRKYPPNRENPRE